jgi:non-heme chloroperoxidase
MIVRAKDGTEIFYRDWGSGPPLVLSASWALSSEMWAYQLAYFADRGYRCVALDRRGHGRSDVPSGGYDMDTLADDLAAALDSLDLHNVVLIGHSMGAAEQIHYLARYGGSRVRKLALLAPAAPYIVQAPDNPFGALPAYYDAQITQWMADFPKWAEDNKAPFFTPQTSPAMMAWLTGQLVRTPPPVAIASFRALLQKDLRPGLARIACPTLILHGDKDAQVPLDFTGRRVAVGIKGAELKVYEGAPHGLFVTHMAQVNRDLETFIRE